MAGFNVADFRAVISDKGVARPNKFLVRLNMPVGLYGTPGTTYNLETVRELEFWAESTNLPMFGLATNMANRYGYGAAEKRPYMPTYQDLQINFIFDEFGDNWHFFYDWMNMIINTKTNRGVNAADGRVNVGGEGNILSYRPWEVSYRVEYVTDLNIKLFDQTGVVIKNFLLREAFPIDMGGQSLDWNDNNSYLRIPIRFSYVDWQHGTLNDN